MDPIDRKRNTEIIMKRILIIEDELEMLRNLTTILRLEKFRPLSAENGRVGVDLAKKQKCLPHFLLFCCNFPGLGPVPRLAQAVKEGAELVKVADSAPAVARRTSEKLYNARSKCPSFAHRRVDFCRSGRWCGYGSPDRLGATRSDCGTYSSRQHHLDGCRNCSTIHQWTYGCCVAR